MKTGKKIWSAAGNVVEIHGKEIHIFLLNILRTEEMRESGYKVDIGVDIW